MLYIGSRAVKRIALDFNYPINGMVWVGYLNPYNSLECKCCDGTGMSPEFKSLYDTWYQRPGWRSELTSVEIMALVDAKRFFHLDLDPGEIPTLEQVNEWDENGVGHDSINMYICVEVRAKTLGYTEPKCKFCKGEGRIWANEVFAKLHKNFIPIEPPAGDGYQLWNTTSEGSPMSPVFKTQEELAKYLFNSNVGYFANQTLTYQEWLDFIKGAIDVK